MASSSNLKAGAAQVDITPEMGIQISGDIGHRRPVKETRDPLFTKALALESGGQRICIVAVDLATVTATSAAEIRRQSQKRFGLEPDCLMLHAVQNHAAPSMGHHMLSDAFRDLPDDLKFLRGGDDRYIPVVIDGVLNAIERAMTSLAPAALHVGRGVDGRVAFNRRFIMRDGKVTTHPKPCDPDILYCEGPIDPEVGVLMVFGPGGTPCAALLHHTCHPAHGYPENWVTAGWPGAWSTLMRKKYGDDFVPLILNGFCGNIHHANHLDPSFHDSYSKMGKILMETTERIIPTLTLMSESRLDARLRVLKIARRVLPQSELQAAKKILADNPTPPWKDAARTAIHWNWVYAMSNMDMQQQFERCSTRDVPVQTLRIGNTAIVAAPGEPFVEEQLRIKLESKAAFTFCAHNCNDYVGYIPTRHALERGGYETRAANWSYLAPEALEQIGVASIELINEMF